MKMGQANSDEAYLLSSCGNDGDVNGFLALAAKYEEEGKLKLAATAYDRAYGLDPENEDIRTSRARVLDRLAVKEHGITFRFVPAGSFLMGSDTGEPDEQPVHPVQLHGYWLSEVPVSWDKYCELKGAGGDPCYRDKVRDWNYGSGFRNFILREEGKIRYHYCVNGTEKDRENLAAKGVDLWSRGYNQKPMVSVSLEAVEELCRQLSNQQVTYRLPTEAEWEKGARGGLINKRYPWGNKQPNAFRCDFNRFENFSILASKTFPPNGYGLYAMSGGVWEWMGDWYDAEYYRTSPRENPAGPEIGLTRVLRGGSWADAAGAVTVSFRMTRSIGRGPVGAWREQLCPNIGFRICREEISGKTGTRRQTAGTRGWPRTAGSLIKILTDTEDKARKEATDTLERLDTRVAEPFIKLLGDKNEFIRREAAWALGGLEGAHIIDSLIKVLEDGDDILSGIAAISLRRQGIPAVEPLIEALVTGNSSARKKAAITLGEIGDAQAVKPLIKVLKEEGRRETQFYAATALGRIGKPAMKPLLEALKDENEDIRYNATEALGIIGNPAISPLVRLLLATPPLDDSDSFFTAVATILQQLSPPAELLSPLKPLLLAYIMGNSDQKARESAKKLLQLIDI